MCVELNLMVHFSSPGIPGTQGLARCKFTLISSADQHRYYIFLSCSSEYFRWKITALHQVLWWRLTRKQSTIWIYENRYGPTPLEVSWFCTNSRGLCEESSFSFSKHTINSHVQVSFIFIIIWRTQGFNCSWVMGLNPMWFCIWGRADILISVAEYVLLGTKVSSESPSQLSSPDRHVYSRRYSLLSYKGGLPKESAETSRDGAGRDPEQVHVPHPLT